MAHSVALVRSPLRTRVTQRSCPSSSSAARRSSSSPSASCGPFSAPEFSGAPWPGSSPTSARRRPPGSLEPALARAMGDPELRIAYWLPASQRYVDGRGRLSRRARARLGCAVTALVRGSGESPSFHTSAAFAELEREIGAAVRLALENGAPAGGSPGAAPRPPLFCHAHRRNGRCRAAPARTQPPRDGAQQRLLALSHYLRVARVAAEAEGDVKTASLLAEAVGDAQAALGEVRVVRPRHPPGDPDRGRPRPGFETLADAAPLAVEIGETAGERYPAAVETAAYLVVAEAIYDRRRGGTRAAPPSALLGAMSVSWSRWTTTARRGTSTMIHLADRVGAVGGQSR